MMNGFILYCGKSLIGAGSIVAIATLQSQNVKTGDMVQIWILPENSDPLDALQQNANGSACGRCPLQGQYDNALGKMVGRVCYVNVGQAPKQIYASYRAGKYPIFNRANHEHLLRGREIRIGAYGDPAALPVRLVRYLAGVGSGWTGYSHQLFWIDPRRSRVLSRYLMASCHTPAMHAEAQRRGWRSFVAIAEGQTIPERAVECPNYTRGVQCKDCGLCRGTSLKARDIIVRAHGRVGANLPILQQLQGSAI